MRETQTDLLTNELIQSNNVPRKKLLPLWMRIFSWVFLIYSVFTPVVLIFGILGYRASLSLYGLETNDPFSVIGIAIIMLFIIKGIVAFGLLKEKYWAIKIGIADAIIGIAFCTFVMLYPIIDTDAKFSVRIELVALIPYLLKLMNVKPAWEKYIEI